MDIQPPHTNKQLETMDIQPPHTNKQGSEIGIEIGIFIAGCILSGICWCCKDSCRYPCPRRRVKRTRNLISIPPPIVERAVNPNVTYTTKEDNIAHIPAVDPPKYETVVTDGSADSTGPYYGQPPPYPSTAGTDIHKQIDDHVTHDTAKLEDNIAYTPAVDPPKYETVVTYGSADSTGPYYGQPPPYPSTDDTDIHEQNDDHVTHDTAKLVKE
ncbi:hypothetical protein FSP39_002958 [Pinctada imbricata]|uniref:Uncharacterized protein n=1 Tax=Pinctada imbricata TaxID=66713 RepID=A0AA88YB10_PINIB|nr:hypothetical protein FSP39_002958 [Pinctada imbricata]